MRTIKKYSNRKMYDSSESRFLNLKDIRDLIVRGETIRILDSAAGEDITSVVMAQIILEQERYTKNPGVSGLFQQIIRKGTHFFPNVIEKTLLYSLGTVSLAEEKMGEIIKTLVERGRITKKEGNYLLSEFLDRVKEGRKKVESYMKEVLLSVDVIKKSTTCHSEFISESKKVRC